MSLPFLDIHTHSTVRYPDILSVQNYIIGREAMDNESLYTAGIHPWYIDADPSLQWQLLETVVGTPQVIGIGECGLDKHCNTDWDLQLGIFERQIKLAKKAGKPLLLHSVRAYQEIAQLLRVQQFDLPVIFHGFNKNIKLAKQLLDAGYYLSLGADIFSGRQDALISEIPLDRLFLETDDKAIDIVAIFSYFCAARKLPIAVLKQQLMDNFERVFNYRIEE
ncbi:TatD family hydrolase [Sphingobacterium tabacisoli]|uniref:TatD family hydrolase n=1 Tax=Sphingobacterium tabacisoli TaxID=2044855 RepID=A0ABW5LAR8_9SPHI|nr:TatD family hydrolase [Sphingobacterium tabacisoli]